MRNIRHVFVVMLSLLLLVSNLSPYAITPVFAESSTTETNTPEQRSSSEIEGQSGAAGNKEIEYDSNNITYYAQSGEGESILFIGGSTSENSINSTSYSGFSRLANDLRSNGYVVSQQSISSVDQYDLLQKDIVIFHVHSTNGLTDSQIEMFRNYVNNGGALLLLGNLHTNSRYDVGKLNGLAKVFGISFLNGLLIDEKNNISNSAIQPAITNFAESPITEGLNKIWLNWGSALKVTPPARALATSGAGSWLETNSTWRSGTWSYSKNSNDIEGPFPVLASSEYGIGRVVAIADGDIFWNDWYNSYGANILFGNMVNWLSQAELEKNIKLHPIYPESEEVASKIMEGGYAIRHYKVTDENDTPLNNFSFRYDINGKTLTEKTNQKGMVMLKTPALTKSGKVEVTGTDLDFSTSFVVEIEEREFEQAWTLTPGIIGEIGFGLGPEVGIGKLGKLDVGADATVGATVGAALEMKYLTYGKNYDLLVGLGTSGEGTVGAGVGLTADLGKAAELSMLNVEAGGGSALTLGSRMLLGNFNNPNSYKDYDKVQLAVFYELLVTGVQSNEKLRNNAVVTKLIEEIGRKLQTDTEFYREFYSLEEINYNTAANLFNAGLKLPKKVEGELAIATASATGVSSLESSMNTKGESIIKMGLQTEADAKWFDAAVELPLLNKNGYYPTLSGIDPLMMIGKDSGIGEVVLTSEEEVTYKDNDVKQYSVSATTEEDQGSGIFITDKKLATLKYTVNEDNIKNYAGLGVIDDAFARRYALFHDPKESLQQLLDHDKGKLEYEAMVTDASVFEFPLQIGLGAGVKVGLGFDIVGEESLQYTTQEGLYDSQNGLIITEEYNYDSIIQNREREMSTALTDLGNMVGQQFSDLFATVTEAVEKFIDTSKEFVDDAVNVITEATVELVKEGGKKVKVAVSKLKDFFGFTIQTENGEALVVGEVFFLSFTDENNESLESLGEETIEFSMTYTDEILAQLGLAGKENNLSIYYWDAASGTYVRMQSVVDATTNIVTTAASEAGQYLLAYNEFNPTVTDFTALQVGNKLTLRSTVLDSFESIDSSSIQLTIDEQAYDSEAFSYSPISGILELSVTNLTPGNHKAVYTIKDGDKTFTYEEDFIVNGQIELLSNVDAAINGNDATFVVDTKENEKVGSITVNYQLNNGIKQSALLKLQDGKWVTTISSAQEIASVIFEAVLVDQNQFVEKSEQKIVQASDVSPLALENNSVASGMGLSTDEIVLHFNHYLNTDSDLSYIVAKDETGKEIGIDSTIVNNQLIIRPAHQFTPGEITISIPANTLDDAAAGTNMNKEAIEFTYTAFDKTTLNRVKDSKIWTVTFSQPVEKNLSSEHIYVTTLSGDVIKTMLKRSEDGLKVEVKTEEPYKVGAYYVIKVDQQLKSLQGRSLPESYSKMFTINNETIE